jgi:hypothetical protein
MRGSSCNGFKDLQSKTLYAGGFLGYIMYIAHTDTRHHPLKSSRSFFSRRFSRPPQGGMFSTARSTTVPCSLPRVPAKLNDVSAGRAQTSTSTAARALVELRNDEAWSSACSVRLEYKYGVMALAPIFINSSSSRDPHRSKELFPINQNVSIYQFVLILQNALLFDQRPAYAGCLPLHLSRSPC